MADNQNIVFSQRFRQLRQKSQRIVNETGGNVALIAYPGHHHRCIEFGDPSVEAVLDQMGYEPDPKPLALIDRARVAVAAQNRLAELSPADLLQLDNNLRQIRFLVRHERENRLGGN